MIDAPSLACFKFEGLTPLDFFMGELPSLNSFRIVLQPHFDGDIYKQRFALLLIKMLMQLCNAKKARLSLRTLEVLLISSFKNWFSYFLILTVNINFDLDCFVHRVHRG